MRIAICAQLILFIFTANGAALASSDYRGEDRRTIKSLSIQDVEDLLQGRGWGLAKPAELNGLPGPVHLLELRERLQLTDEQVQRIEELYKTMNAAAIEAGKLYIERERELEAVLRETHPNQPYKDPGQQKNALKAAADAAALARSALRQVHLQAHLQTPAILNARQLETYQVLRGYDTSDPCQNPPQGHNSAMWRQHNNCH